MNTEISEIKHFEADVKTTSESADLNEATDAQDLAADAPSDASGIDPMIRDLLQDSTVCAEYGAGPITAWALENTSAKVIAVHTAAKELARATRGQDFGKRLTSVHVNLGKNRRGRPLSYDAKDQFSSYTDAIWDKKPLPDTVFINGCFRVCCFLTALTKAAPGTKIVISGYTNSGTLRIVEDFLKPSKVTDQMALFEVPEEGKLDMENIEKNIAMFRMVME